MGARALAAALVAVAWMAGCMGSDAPAAEADDAKTGATGDAAEAAGEASADADAAAADAAPPPIAIPLALDGRIPTGLLVCAEALPEGCEAQEVGEARTDIRVEGLVGTITGATLNVTWTAASPLTEELGVGVMTMWPGCDDCPHEEFAHVIGTSPIQIDVQGLNVPIGEEGLLHVYVYAAGALESPVYVGAAVDQPFTVEGAATLAPA